jgi:hypothetical protein
MQSDPIFRFIDWVFGYLYNLIPSRYCNDLGLGSSSFLQVVFGLILLQQIPEIGRIFQSFFINQFANIVDAYSKRYEIKFEDQKKKQSEQAEHTFDIEKIRNRARGTSKQLEYIVKKLFSIFQYTARVIAVFILWMIYKKYGFAEDYLILYTWGLFGCILVVIGAFQFLMLYSFAHTITNDTTESMREKLVVRDEIAKLPGEIEDLTNKRDSAREELEHHPKP